jgi:hypothetical protein
MLKTVYAIGAAAIIAGAFITTLSLTDTVEAHGSSPAVKADRADIRPLAGNCSELAWPYFEAGCLRDVRNPYGQARPVRVIGLDRLAAAAPSGTR